MLDGGDALLLTHSPFFQAEPCLTPSKGFHKESPAGVLANKYSIETSGIRFNDPHASRGGFGGSGAEFLSVFEVAQSIRENEKFAWTAFDTYKALNLPGSGIDILAQSFARNRPDCLVQVSQNPRKISSINSNMGLSFRIFHTGKKLATHENLAKPKLPFDVLQAITQKAAYCAQRGEAKDFAKCIQSYANTLAELGLLAAHSKKALENLPKHEAILAAKGCGAMGSDVLLVILQDDFDLKPWANENSLAEIAKVSV